MTEGAPLDPPGPRITYVNPAFTRVTGYDADEVIGRTPRLLQGPATESWVLDRLRRRLQHGKPFTGEAINYRKDGTPYVNHWSISPIRNENDTITHWISVQRDVTERRSMGERLEEVQGQERARMARTFHDELGGHLTSLQMSLEQVRSCLSDEQHSATAPLNALEENIRTLSSTIRQLTEHFSSRVLDDFGLAEAAARLVSDIETEDGLPIELRNEIPPGEKLPPVLERVVFRVLKNTLTTLVCGPDTEATRVLLQKIDQELRLQVLHRGPRLAPPSAPQDGAGSGLSALRERIARLNGTLSINASREEGSRLTVTLPITPMSLPDPS
jgi:PAS domain S-box-containing protein